MAFHVSFIALLIVTVTHHSIGGLLPATGRREQDIIVYRPVHNVIGPPYGHSIYGGQDIYNARPPIESRPVDNLQDGEFPLGSRALDTHINKPQSYAPYGQQFYQGDHVHNAPVAYAVMGSGFGRRAQDIIIFKPGKNVIGPAYGQSHYGGQVIQNSRPGLARQTQDGNGDEGCGEEIGCSYP